MCQTTHMIVIGALFLEIKKHRKKFLKYYKQINNNIFKYQRNIYFPEFLNNSK